MIKALLRYLLWPFYLFFTSGNHKAVDEVALFYMQNRFSTDNTLLKNELEQHDFPTFPAEHNGTGGGAYTVRGRLIIGGEGSGGGQELLSGDYQYAMGTGGGGFMLGLLLLKSRLIRFYPMLVLGGMGGGGAVYKPSSSTEQLMPTMEHESKLMEAGYFNPVLHIGFGLEFKVGGKSGIIIGVRTGYNINPLSKSPISPHTRFIIGGLRNKSTKDVLQEEKRD